MALSLRTCACEGGHHQPAAAALAQHTLSGPREGQAWSFSSAMAAGARNRKEDDLVDKFEAEAVTVLAPSQPVGASLQQTAFSAPMRRGRNGTIL